MELEHDPAADAVYIRLRSMPYAFGQSLDDHRHIDFAEDEQPMGIELLGVSHGVMVDGLPDGQAVERLLLQHNVKVHPLGRPYREQRAYDKIGTQ